VRLSLLNSHNELAGPGQDGSGEIDREEMMDIFEKLCKYVQQVQVAT
jgi:hypothetical protein